MDLARYVCETRGFPSAVRITRQGTLGSSDGSSATQMAQMIERLMKNA